MGTGVMHSFATITVGWYSHPMDSSSWISQQLCLSNWDYWVLWDAIISQLLPLTSPFIIWKWHCPLLLHRLKCLFPFLPFCQWKPTKTRSLLQSTQLGIKSCLGSANLCHDGIEGMAAVNIFLSWPQIRTARIVTIFIFQDEWFSLTSMEAWNPWWQHKQHWLLTLDLCALYWPIGQCFNLAF